MRHFRKLVEQHQRRIYGFAYYFMGNREDAEEITQDVLLSLWRHGRQVDPERLPAWITRVTRNECLDAIRRRRRYQERVTEEDEDLPLAETAAGDDDPAKTAETAEFRRHLEQALRQLAEPYRTIVILREIQDMTYEEIVEATGLVLNTVKAYLHRGRRMLRTQLQETMDDDDR